MKAAWQSNYNMSIPPILLRVYLQLVIIYAKGLNYALCSREEKITLLSPHFSNTMSVDVMRGLHLQNIIGLAYIVSISRIHFDQQILTKLM